MASVLGVSLYQLLLPLDGEAVDITPSIAAGRHDLSLWLRGLRPLRDEDRAAFNRQVPSEDLEPDTVAEQAVWSERNRVAGLTAALSEAVDSMNRAQVKHFMALAGHALDEVSLRGADAHRIDTRELEASVRRGNRFLRQNLAR